MSAVQVSVKTAALRSEIADILKRVCNNGTRATITRYGEPVAVVMPIQEVQELDRLRAICRARGMYKIGPDLYNIPPQGKAGA